MSPAELLWFQMLTGRLDAERRQRAQVERQSSENQAE